MAEQPPSPAPAPSTTTLHPRRRSSDGPTAFTPGLTRRQSTQERINDILKTARERAEGLHSPAGQTSPRRMEPLLPRGAAAEQQQQQHESSADEAPGGSRKRPERWRGPSPTQTMNYQSTATASSGARARGRRNGNGAGAEGGGDAGGEGRAEGAREGAAGEGGEQGVDEKWWRKMLSNFQSIELENKGSVARDHLALERTFLAWLRTSLAFASIGIAITQLFRLNTTLASGPDDKNGRLQTLRRVGKPLGATFLALSILMLFLGYNRYHTSQQWIMRGKFPASRGTVLIVSLVAFGLMIASLVVVVVSPGAEEK